MTDYTDPDHKCRPASSPLWVCGCEEAGYKAALRAMLRPQHNPYARLTDPTGPAPKRRWWRRG